MARRRDDNSSERYRDDFAEREYEERIEARRRRSGNPSESTRRDNRDNRDNRTKAPLLLRVLAWCGVILLCFVAGYLGTNYMLRYLEKQVLLKPDGRVTNAQDAQALLSADSAADSDVPDMRLDMQKATLTLFYPKDGVLMEESADIISRTREENIQEAVHRLMVLSGLFGKDIRVTHVFRNADTVYLDFSGGFIPALSAAGARPSTLFITGIVRTLRDNFSPITRVRFLVDSKITSTGSPVDLTATWQLPK